MAKKIETTPIIEMRHISKAFGAVQALRDVDLKLHPGEILGLVGDNSAGKSTLMKILTGAYHRDSGEVLVGGSATNFRSPHESRDAGIEMIYQDFALCGNMDVGQNIFLGRWPVSGWFVDRKATQRLLETMLELKRQGVAQIIISHRLQDIFAVGDRVMVLKRGENVGERDIKSSSENEVLHIIVAGRTEAEKKSARRRKAK